MRRACLLLLLTACSSAPSAKQPAPPAPPPVAIDAGVDAAPDAGLPQAVLDAPAWMFRFTTDQRKETWTLRFAGGQALLVVEGANGPQRYTGTAIDGATLAVNVATPTAKMSLDCKHAKRAVSATCNDRKAKPIDVLDCYHPDFKEPMPFGPAPGVEYVVSKACTGYRLPPP